MRKRERAGGSGGANVSASSVCSHHAVESAGGRCGGVDIGVGLDGCKRGGPLSKAIASRIMECNRCN